MNTPTKQFLLNKLSTELSLKGGNLDIPPMSYVTIRSTDAEEASIIYALDRHWAELLNDEPKTKGVKAEAVKVEITEPYKGLTIDELKVEQAAKAAEVSKAEAAESETVEETPKTKKAK